MVGERLTMTEASSRRFEHVAVGCAVEDGGVGAWRVLLAALTSVASERTAWRTDRRGSINSPFWEGFPPDAHPDVPLTYLKCIYGRTVRQNPVKACTLGSQSTPFVFVNQKPMCRTRATNAQDWSPQTSSPFSRKWIASQRQR